MFALPMAPTNTYAMRPSPDSNSTSTSDSSFVSQSSPGWQRFKSLSVPNESPHIPTAPEQRGKGPVCYSLFISTTHVLVTFRPDPSFCCDDAACVRSRLTATPPVSVEQRRWMAALDYGENRRFRHC